MLWGQFHAKVNLDTKNWNWWKVLTQYDFIWRIIYIFMIQSYFVENNGSSVLIWEFIAMILNIMKIDHFYCYFNDVISCTYAVRLDEVHIFVKFILMISNYEHITAFAKSQWVKILCFFNTLLCVTTSRFNWFFKFQTRTV